MVETAGACAVAGDERATGVRRGEVVAEVAGQRLQVFAQGALDLGRPAGAGRVEQRADAPALGQALYLAAPGADGGGGDAGGGRRRAVGV